MADIRKFFGASSKRPASIAAQVVEKAQETKEPSSLPPAKQPAASQVQSQGATTADRDSQVSSKIAPEDDLIDSDEEPETNKVTRQRLKSSKAVLSQSSVPKPESNPSTKPSLSKNHVIALIDDNNQLESDRQPGTKRRTEESNQWLEDLNPSHPKKQRSAIVAQTTSEDFSRSQTDESKILTGLKVLDKSSTGENKKRKEIIGGVGAFFGEAPETQTDRMQIPPSLNSPATKKPKQDPPLNSPEPSTEEPPTRVRAKSPKKSPMPKNSKPQQGIDGLKFVLTGVLASMDRSTAEDFILSRGGKIAGSVSGKTDFLLIGNVLEDGRPVTEGSKYRAAKEKGVSILTEEELFEMTKGLEPINQTPIAPSAKPEHPRSETAVSDNVDVESRLWVDKYRPSSVNEIIGSADIVKKLSDWLSKWDAVHVQHTLKIPFAKENPGAKIALLSGPPGVGKTTMATLVAKYHGYETLELNASDARSKKAVGAQLRDVASSTSITANGASASRKRVIIMDEVDGMSGNSDRGGIQELLSVAKVSKCPIICICNDRQSPRIKSLANSAYDLRVKRPTKTQIASRMVAVAAKEGLTLDLNAAEMLVEQSGNDIRQVIHALQMWRNTSDNMSYMSLKSSLGRIEKDRVLRQTPFDACLSILGGDQRGAAPTFEDRFNAFFIDYSLIPLMIQQNYLEAAKAGIFRKQGPDTGDDVSKMLKLAEASDAASDIDLAAGSIRGDDQHWELLPAQAAMCVRVGSLVNGFLAFPTFPAWLGKNSTTGKNQRLTRELANHTALSVNQNFEAMRMEYVPYLRSHLLSQLTTPTDPASAVKEVISVLDSYGLSRDDFFETLRELQVASQSTEKDPRFGDRFESLDSKLKALFTRTYNSGEHPFQALMASQVAKRKPLGRGKGVQSAEDDEDDWDEDGEVEGDAEGEKDDAMEEDDAEEISKMFMKKAKSSSSSKTVAPSSSKASTSSSKAASSKAATSKTSKKN